jgi:hypothetical protein
LFMKPAIASLPTLEELRKYVHESLCAPDRLDPGQTPLYQGMVKRKDRPCGLFFQVRGPRQLKTYALWVGEENRILFYDSTGLRFAETRLSDGPDPLKLAG